MGDGWESLDKKQEIIAVHDGLIVIDGEFIFLDTKFEDLWCDRVFFIAKNI